MATTTKIMQAFDGADARPPVIITGLTGNGTAGTRSTHAHGQSYTPRAVIPVPNAADADGAVTSGVSVVSFDATNVVVRCAMNSQPFSLVIIP